MRLGVDGAAGYWKFGKIFQILYISELIGSLRLFTYTLLPHLGGLPGEIRARRVSKDCALSISSELGVCAVCFVWHTEIPEPEDLNQNN